MPHRTNFQRKKEQAILALLTHDSIARAAKSIDMSERGLRLWLKKPDFFEAYVQARADLLQHAVGHIAQALVGAAVVLRAVCLDPDAPATARVNAARSIFELALKDREIMQFEGRLATLEQLVKTLTGDGHAPW
jgi:hypothetical protein